MTRRIADLRGGSLASLPPQVCDITAPKRRLTMTLWWPSQTLLPS